MIQTCKGTDCICGSACLPLTLKGLCSCMSLPLLLLCSCLCSCRRPCPCPCRWPCLCPCTYLCPCPCPCTCLCPCPCLHPSLTQLATLGWECQHTQCITQIQVYDSACALSACVNMSISWCHLLSHTLSQLNMHELQHSTCLISKQMYMVCCKMVITKG